MIIDRTEGETAKYMVAIYRWNADDRYIYNNYKDANDMFNRIVTTGKDEGTSVSLYDMAKDIRKAYHRF